MAHTVRIKRRSATSAAPTSLANAELAFNESSEILYYGKGTGGAGGSASSIISIGGIGAFVGLSGDQSIGGTKTFTGTVIVPTPTATTHATTKTYVDSNTLSSSISSTQSGYFGDIYLYDDSTPSHYLQITNSANLTAARVFSLNVNDANRTVSLSGDLTLANNFTTSGNFALTLTTTASTNVTLPTTGTLATTGNLSQFASTTSGQLATLISDETGSGVLVFGTSPAITTSITTPSTSFDVFNTTATTVNAFGDATTLAIGNTATAAQTVNMFTASTGSSTYNIATGGTLSGNTKTVNFGTGGVSGNTTNVTIGGKFGGTTTITSPTVTCNFATTVNLGAATTVNINGTDPTIASASTGTLTLFNTNLTTVNAFQAATAISIGATTGTTTVRNDLSVTKSVTATEGFRVGSSAINTQTIAYSLQASDNGKIVTVNSGTAVDVTVGTAVGAAGFSCTVIQLGAGQVTFVASGTTLNSANGLKISAQHGAATLFCYATNTFNVAGNLTT